MKSTVACAIVLGMLGMSAKSAESLEVVSFCAGAAHTCALLDDKKLKCWGSNTDESVVDVARIYGQLGLGINTATSIGDEAGEMIGLTDVKYGTGNPIEVTCGSHHTCLLFNDGTGQRSKCWGLNFGRLVLGTETNVGDGPGEMGEALLMSRWGTYALDLNKLLNVVKVKGYKDRTCAILNDPGKNFDVVKCAGGSGPLSMSLTSGQWLGGADNLAKGHTEATVMAGLPVVDLGWFSLVGEIPYQPIDLAVGPTAKHTCIILEGGGKKFLKCFGRNTEGQLGLGDATNRGGGAGAMGDLLPVVNLGTNMQPEQVSLGRYHTCVIRKNTATSVFSTVCFGMGDNGRLVTAATTDVGDGVIGSGLMGASLVEAKHGAAKNPKQVALGFDFTCFLYEDDLGIKCFGKNLRGQLGRNNTADAGHNAATTVPTLPYIGLGTNLPNIKSIHAGGGSSDFANDDIAVLADADGGHVCAVFEGAKVKCWGWNNRGQLGLENKTPKGISAPTMGNFLPFINLLGTSSPTKSPTQTAFPTASPTTELSGQIKTFCAGKDFNCALLYNGKMKCFGQNDVAQLGLGASLTVRGDGPNEMGTVLPYLVYPPGYTAAVDITCGERHVCALFPTGETKCWGSNGSGRLITGAADVSGTSSITLTPTLISTKWDNNVISKVKQVVAGKETICAILDNINSDVKCAGENAAGQLGINSALDTGVKVGDANPITALGTSLTPVKLYSGPLASHTCVKLVHSNTDVFLKCWGLNDKGQLGLGDQFNRGDLSTGPAPFEMGSNLPAISVGGVVVQVSLGAAHTCVIREDQEAICWGEALNGRLVSASVNPPITSPPITPVKLGKNSEKAAWLALGTDFSCFVLASNAGVKCFGANGSGQLGQDLPTGASLGINLATLGDNVLPINIGIDLSLLPIKSIHAGESHVCVVFVGGISVKCWGGNGVGQLGVGNTNNRGTDEVLPVNKKMVPLVPFTDIFGATKSPTPKPTTATATPTKAPTTQSPTTPSPTQANATPSPTQANTPSPTQANTPSPTAPQPIVCSTVTKKSDCGPSKSPKCNWKAGACSDIVCDGLPRKKCNKNKKFKFACEFKNGACRKSVCSELTQAQCGSAKYKQVCAFSGSCVDFP